MQKGGKHKAPVASATGASEVTVDTHEPAGTESVASVHRSCSARSAWIWRYTRSPPMAASATRRSFFTALPRLSLT